MELGFSSAVAVAYISSDAYSIFLPTSSGKFLQKSKNCYNPAYCSIFLWALFLMSLPLFHAPGPPLFLQAHVRGQHARQDHQRAEDRGGEQPRVPAGRGGQAGEELAGGPRGSLA